MYYPDRLRDGGPLQKLRMESLTDLVFGLALALSSITLIIRADETVGEIVYSLFWFSFNFIILISVWFAYSTLLENIRIETPVVLWLNVFLLLLVSMEPYVLNLMAFTEDPQGFGGLLDSTSSLYGLTLGGIWLIMGALYHQAAKGGGSALTRQLRDDRLVDAAIFLLSAAPVFWDIELVDVPVRFWMWFLTIPVGAALSATRKAREKRGERTA